MIQYFDNNLRQQRQIYSTFGNVCLLLKEFLWLDLERDLAKFLPSVTIIF